MQWAKIVALALKLVLFLLERAKETEQLERGAAIEIEKRLKEVDDALRKAEAARAAVPTDAGSVRDDDGFRRD